MADVRVKVDRDAVRSILKGPAVSGILSEQADRVADAANARVPATNWWKNPRAFEPHVGQSAVSAVANVVTANPTGMNYQAKHHILESSI